MVKFAYKIFRQGSETLLAVCDAEITGKKFSEGSVTLDVDKDFYMENTADEDEILGLAKKATIINAVGNAVVRLLEKEKMVQCATTIAGIKHAQVIEMK